MQGTDEMPEYRPEGGDASSPGVSEDASPSAAAEDAPQPAPPEEMHPAAAAEDAPEPKRDPRGTYRFTYTNDVVRIVPVVVFALLWWSFPGLLSAVGVGNIFAGQSPFIMPVYMICGLLAPMALMRTVLKRLPLFVGTGEVGDAEVTITLKYSTRVFRYGEVANVVYDSPHTFQGGLQIVSKDGKGLSIPPNTTEPDESLHNFADALKTAVQASLSSGQ